MHFLTRSQAARAAQKVSLLPGAFRTYSIPDRVGRVWKYGTTQKNTPAVDWAKGKDYVSWVETDFIDEGRSPGLRGVLVVTCRIDEIPSQDQTEALALGYSFSPITPELFNLSSATERPIAGARAKSEAESPVKTVWRIADEMKGADRKAVIAACIAAGVNKATASTQVYRWQKAQSV